jgi:tRNA(Ile)-lysidine synthase
VQLPRIARDDKKLAYLAFYMKGSVVDRIQAAVHDALPRAERSLLAVSGGIDSMVLFHAARSVRDAGQIAVATFDHASGPHSEAAANLVQQVAMSAGVLLVVGRGEQRDQPSEADWRADRIAFLRASAHEYRAVICTAHTYDDQVETVLFRELRGAGPRGLAGLAAETDIKRPLLAFSRADVSDYARAAGVEWVNDPSNLDRSFSRNRLRHELLPAMRVTHPRIDGDLAAIGERAARWRADVDVAIDAHIRFDVDQMLETLEVDGASLRGLDDDALGIVWPALLARLGVAADWRGTRRLVAFTTRGKTGQRIQLSGGWTVFRRRGGFEVRRVSPTDR